MELNELRNRVEEIDEIIKEKVESPFYISVMRCSKVQEELGEVADVLIGIKVVLERAKSI